MMPPGMILAGGRSRRMGGGDKGLLPLNGKPILAHVIARIAPQVSGLAINGNGDGARFRPFGLPVVADTIQDFAGPLAGILAALTWAKKYHPHASHVLTAPCDTPFLPRDLVRKLSSGLAQTGADIAVARDSETAHPVVGLWPIRMAESLAEAVAKDGLRSVHHWLRQCHSCETVFAAGHFHNINTPGELTAAQTITFKKGELGKALVAAR